MRVEPKVVEVLVYLAQRGGHVVSRDELLTAVWTGVVVGDDARHPTYIETLAKRGYRLIAPVARATEVPLIVVKESLNIATSARRMPPENG